MLLLIFIFFFFFFFVVHFFFFFFFFFSSRRRHTRLTCDWSSDVCSSDLASSRGEAQAPDRRRWRSPQRRQARRGAVERRWSSARAAEQEREATRSQEIGRASCRERV